MLLQDYFAEGEDRTDSMQGDIKLMGLSNI